MNRRAEWAWPGRQVLISQYLMFYSFTLRFNQAEARQAGNHVIARLKVHGAKLADISSTMVGLYSGNGLLLKELPG